MTAQDTLRRNGLRVPPADTGRRSGQEGTNENVVGALMSALTETKE